MRIYLIPLVLLLAGCGGRTLELPANSPGLIQSIESSTDAAGLSRQLAQMGYSRISVTFSSTPAGQEYRWTPETSDRLIMFWRIFTREPRVFNNGTREYALKLTPQGEPRTIALDEPPLLAELASKGDALARSGKWREAGRAWEKARLLTPSLPLLHARLGDFHTATGEYAKAFADYSRAIAMRGAHPDIYTGLGIMFEKSRRPRDAEDALEKSAGLDPDSPARWVRLARSQFLHGKKAPALKSLTRALALAPGNPEALKLKSVIGIIK